MLASPSRLRKALAFAQCEYWKGPIRSVSHTPMFRGQVTEAREREGPALGQAELWWDQLVANPEFLPKCSIWNNSSDIKLTCSNVYHIPGTMLKFHWIFPNTIIIPSLQMENWGSEIFRCLDVSFRWINKWLLAGSCYFPSILMDANLAKLPPLPSELLHPCSKKSLSLPTTLISLSGFSVPWPELDVRNRNLSFCLQHKRVCSTNLYLAPALCQAQC